MLTPAPKKTMIKRPSRKRKIKKLALVLAGTAWLAGSAVGFWLVKFSPTSERLARDYPQSTHPRVHAAR